MQAVQIEILKIHPPTRVVIRSSPLFIFPPIISTIWISGKNIFPS